MILTNDEIAAGIFGKTAWLNLSDRDRLLMAPIIEDSEAAITRFLGSVTHSARIETHRLPEITPGVTTVDYPVYRPGQSSLWLRHIPMDYNTVVIYEGDDRVELTRDTHFYTTDVDIIDDNGTERKINRSGRLIKKSSVSWRFPVEVRYNGGYSPVVSPNEWRLIKKAMLRACKDGFISAVRNIGVDGSLRPGTIRREQMGEYEYEMKDQSGQADGADGASAAYGLSPAAIAILWELKNTARYL